MFDNIILNISEDMSEIKINELLKSEEYEEEYEYEINELSDKVKDGKDCQSVYSEIYDNIKNEKFARIIISDLDNNIKPFLETEFIRQIELSDFKKYTEIIFYNAILQVSSFNRIKELTKIQDEAIISVLKFLKYSKILIIVKRYTKELFAEIVYDKFRLYKESSEFIWDLFHQNRKELIISVMMENSDMIRSINNSVSIILDIFDDLTEEE